MVGITINEIKSENRAINQLCHHCLKSVNIYQISFRLKNLAQLLKFQLNSVYIQAEV